MTQAMSVLEKALKFRAEANRLREGAQAHEEAARVSNRVDETMAVLDSLNRVVSAARRLQSVAGMSIDMSKADEGRDRFVRLAVGLPPNSVFAAAKKRIQGAEATIADQVAGAWATWTSQRVQELPLLRITLLAGRDQAAAKQRRDELQKLARKQLPSSADIDLFSTSWELLVEMLDTVADPPPEIVDLLNRLGQRPALTLDDVTDGQITLLRTAGIADQIEVHRRGL